MIVAHKSMLLLAAIYLFEPTNGGVSHLTIPANPKHPGKCFIAKGTSPIGNARKNIIMSVGEKRPAPRGHCFELKCSKNDDEYSIAMYSCFVSSTKQPDCRNVIKERLPYPKCCPKLECDSPLTYPVWGKG